MKKRNIRAFRTKDPTEPLRLFQETDSTEVKTLKFQLEVHRRLSKSYQRRMWISLIGNAILIIILVLMMINT